MNTIRPFLIGTLAGALLLPASQAGAGPIVNGVNPNYVKVKVYELRASQNDDCSDLVPIFSNPGASYVDASHNPTFGSGVLPHGTYRCFAMKMSDQIISQPASDQGTHGVCIGGSSVVTQDIAQPWTAGIYSQAPDGSHIPLTTGEDIVWLYWRTAGSSGNDPIGDASFVPSKGMLLAAPVTVTSDRDLTFVFNFDGKVGESTNDGFTYACSADAPVMSVR